ncbi:DELTA-actitoxin-Aeq1b-like isoform X2 [Acropora muricata]|uniref:DELTA-actitoxin-Aeq1b-like isoform X2 n=1 Tax=Acropora muricata TaxID=159855 RepID=UPI0034E4C0BE
MDRLSFVSSLLLIVSVTATLGSVIKAKNPNGEELEALLKRSHDAQAKLKGEKSSRDKDSEMFKQIGVLRGHRLVSITITNEVASCLKDPFILKVFGTAENTLPATLKAGKKGSFHASSEIDNILGETAGVFTYYIPVIRKSVAVMWSSSPLFLCYWNVKLYDNYPSADEKMYFQLASRSYAYPGDDNPYKKPIGEGLKVSGRMTCGANSVLSVTVLSNA